MKTETLKTAPAVTITHEAYSERRDALDELPTPALQKARKAIEKEMLAAEQRGSGEDAYTLQCLRDWADTLLESRTNGYTGQYEN